MCFTALLLFGCAQAPACNAPYAAQTYIAQDSFLEECLYNAYGFGKTVIISTYKEYENTGLELNYDKDYFKTNGLLVLLHTGCSSDKVRFTGFSDKNGVLAPVIYSHEYLKDEVRTDDVIFYVFYSEIPKDKNHTAGEIIFVYDR